MAEAIFNKFCDIDNVTAYSAGISVVPGSRTSYNAAYVVKKYIDVDITSRKAVQITKHMVESANIIFTMTENIRHMLVNSLPDSCHKVFTLKEAILQQGDIADPFGGDMGDYEVVYRELEDSILALLKKLKGDTGIG